MSKVERILLFIGKNRNFYIILRKHFYSCLFCRENIFYIFYKNQLFKMINIMIREILWFKIILFNESILSIVNFKYA